MISTPCPILGFSPLLRLDPVGHSGSLGLWLPPFPLCSLGSAVGHSGPLSLWLPLPVSLTRTTSTIIHSLDPVGHSGPLGPWLIPCLFSLLFSLLLHHCLDSVGHSGPLGLWLPPPVSFTLTTFITFTIIHSLDSVGDSGPCLFSFLISLLLHHCLDSVGHSGPLGLWRPLFLFFHSPYFLFHHFPTSSPPPGLSRSFRPTRSLAAFILSSTHLSFFSTFALTQSVIPAHSVSGYLSSIGSYPSPFLFLPSSSGLPTPIYSLYARDSVTGSPNPLIPFVSSFFSARRPVAMGIQSDLRCVATSVDPK